MKVVTQVAEQRKTLEQAVAQALELARVGSDAAEVAVSKTTGISVSTRFGEVENVEFNSDGALGITVYHQQRKGSASTTDLNPDAVARTVQAALDIARYTSPDPTPDPQTNLCWPLMHQIWIYSILAIWMLSKVSCWRPAQNRRHCRLTSGSPIPRGGVLTAIMASKSSVTATVCCKATAPVVTRSRAV